MQNKVKITDCGSIEYKAAWDKQEEIFGTMQEVKKTEETNFMHHFLYCEHPHVYTLGKSGEQQNLLITEEFLKKIDATFYKTNRGGDITYHGPGQIVGYPIFDIEALGLSIKSYIFKLEEVIIKTIAELGIQGTRLEGATGVWVPEKDGAPTSKICAIGVKASRYITMHGFALNVNTDLNYFSYINPCGFTDKAVTSVEKELGRKLSLQSVKEIINQKLKNIFTLEIVV